VTRRPLELRTGKRPFQVVVMFSGVLSGAAGLIFGAQSNVVVRAFPGYLTYGWYLSLTVWSAVVLAAAVMEPGTRLVRDVVGREKIEFRLELERAGLYGFGFSCMAYGVAAVTLAGLPGLTAALFVGLFGLAALIRVREIHVDLNKLRRALGDPQFADPPPLADPGGG
jgi:hypothetical protein